MVSEKISKMYTERELDVSMKCIKYMLFIANFMFLLVGFLLLSIGMTVKAIYGTFDHFLNDHFYGASNLAIVVGFIIFMVALFGCVGAVKESVCLINTYALFLFVVLILEICISIVAYATRKDLEQEVHSKMAESMQFYDSYTQYSWNATQYNLLCCGVDGPQDWQNISSSHMVPVPPPPSNFPFNVTNITVPATCCRNEACDRFESLYKMGCLPRVTLLISECSLMLGIGAMCISFIQILGVVFAHLLAKSVRKLKTQMLVEVTERRQALYEQLAKSAQTEKSTPVLYTSGSSEA